MKYLKRFNEELSPDFLDRVAGDRSTPQKQRIGAQADLRKNLQNPEYVKAEADKKRREEIARKYPIFGEGMYLDIWVVKLENYRDDKNLIYESIKFGAKANIKDNTIQLYVKSESDSFLAASFTENGIKFSNIKNFINKNFNYLEERGYINHNVSQISFIGFDRGTLNTFTKIIKELYPTSTVSATNFNITSDEGETKKAGIYEKDFDEGDSRYAYDGDLVDSVNIANKFAIPSIKI